MKNTRRQNQGFTLAELLVALMVSAILLTSIASLSFAISAAGKGSDEIIEKQTRIRFLQLRLNELINNCKMICHKSSTDLAIWKGDLDGDNQIDSQEMVYIYIGSLQDKIRILEFNDSGSSNITLSQIVDGTAASSLLSTALESNTMVVDGCSNVSFVLDTETPRSRFVAIKLEYDGPDSITKYEIGARVLSDVGYMLDDSNDIYTQDDD